MDKPRYCLNCYNKPNGPIKKLTEFWCKTCFTPLCPDLCYDEHRKFEFLIESDDEDPIT